MKVYMDADEWYPVYTLEIYEEGGNKPWGKEIDVPPDMWDAYCTAMTEFKKVQKYLTQLAETVNV